MTPGEWIALAGTAVTVIIVVITATWTLSRSIGRTVGKISDRVGELSERLVESATAADGKIATLATQMKTTAQQVSQLYEFHNESQCQKHAELVKGLFDRVDQLEKAEHGG